MATRVVDVTVEHLPVPLGVGVARPRLSWRVDTDESGWHQDAYEILVEAQDGATTGSGRVDSAAQVLVAWPGAPLTSREVCDVRVRVWSGGEPSPWSDPVRVEAGLLDPRDWSAALVQPEPPSTPDEQPVALLRKEFVLRGPVRRARVYTTAHGIHDVEVNGQPVSEDLLGPGWTAYARRLRYSTYDVTPLLRDGDNAVGIRLADGWWRGYLGFGGQRALYGDRTGAWLQLEVEHDDGTWSRVVTDDSWRCTPGPIVSADLYNGEATDLRRGQSGWSTAGFDDAGWSPVTVGDLDPATLVAPTGPAVRRTEVVPAREVLTTPDGATVVDFGVNLVGRLRLRVPDAPAGTTITLRHAEVLEHGELGTRPLRLAKATDSVVLDGRGDRVWEPHFTVHGFRYAQVDGWPGALRPEDVEAVVLHTDLEPTGEFACSDDDLNTLHDNVIRSLRGNVVDIPTDCPQRDERLGWTGDIAVFAPTASFLYDMSGMLTSWLRDLAAEQREDGVVPLYVPSPAIRSPEFEFPLHAEAGWGDASVVVPWTLYERHGDEGILREQWPSMTAWVQAFARRAGADLDFPDSGMMLGDWLDANAPDDEPWKARVAWPFVALCYLARSARILAQVGEILGHDDEPREYAALADRCGIAFRQRYLDDAGRLTETGQTAYALAIVFDLLDTPDQRQQAGDDLAAQVAADGFHIGTGFLGTPYVCDALTRTGHLDTAYRLLLQRECPSWLYPVTMGATTIWERWNSMLPDGTINPGAMTSFNHYAFGAIADWMHRTVGGLAPDAAGYARARVAPRPGGGLSWARTAHRTPYGWLRVDWCRDGDRLVVDLEVPPGVEAVASLPDGSDDRILPNGVHQLSCAWAER